VSVPQKPRQKPSALEVAATWGILFSSVRSVFIEYGINPNDATKQAAEIAALLTKETDYGIE